MIQIYCETSLFSVSRPIHENRATAAGAAWNRK
jgi:hypothetical protein